MRTLVQLSIFFAASIAATGVTQATPLSASSILSGFNGVIFGNLSSTSDIEGPIVIGGDLTGNSHTFNNNPRSTTPTGFGAVTVYGNASGGPYNVNNGGDVYVGGSNTAKFNFNGGGQFLSSVPNDMLDFSAVGDGPNGLSAMLLNIAVNSTINAADKNNVQFNAAPDSSGIAVFDVSAAILESYAGFNVNLNGASTVVINIDASGSGGKVSLNNHFNNESSGRQNVIWNFYNTDSLSLGTQWGGVILAPNAAVTNNTNIEGVLVAKLFNGHGELHDYPYLGTLPSASVSVSEPSDLGMFGGGLLILSLLTVYTRPQNKYLCSDTTEVRALV
jgi:choice-of-anchor A domain-containing protein